MKFRIPRNSLFGVLLRSPWWVSMILAVVLAAIFAALIPREYVFIALIGTLPILVIGLVMRTLQRAALDDKNWCALAQDARRLPSVGDRA